MWNKKSSEEDAARPRPVPAPTAQPAPAQSPSAPRPINADPPKSVAVLGKNVIVKGEIYTQEDLIIDGEVEGTVEAVGHRLTIGPNGRLQANNVKAAEVVIMGRMKGSIQATDKVYIRKEAQLIGDVQTAGIIIEDGAYFKGGIDIRKGDGEAAAAASSGKR